MMIDKEEQLRIFRGRAEDIVSFARSSDDLRKCMRYLVVNLNLNEEDIRDVCNAVLKDYKERHND